MELMATPFSPAFLELMEHVPKLELFLPGNSLKSMRNVRPSGSLSGRWESGGYSSKLPSRPSGHSWMETLESGEIR